MKAMSLKKCVIKENRHYIEIVYSRHELIDDKNCFLLGFKDSIPVISNVMFSPNKKSKTLKVEVNNQTGEKFLNLNGKKLKIVPESELPGFLRKKIVKAPECLSADTTKIEESQIESKVNNAELSPVIKIREINTQIAKIPVSCGTNVEANYTDKAPYEDEDKTNATRLKNNLNTYKSASKMQPLALIKKVDKFSQTDNNLVETSVQTDSYDSLSDIFNLNLDELLCINSPAPEIISNDTFDCAPSENLVALNDTVGNQNQEATKFFTELRSALQADDKGNMPIHVGVLTDDFKLVKRSWFVLNILKQPVDLPNNSDFTPLQLAIIHNAGKDIIQFLLSKGARLAVSDMEGNNIFHLAVEYERTQELTILLEEAVRQQFNLDQFNHEGLTPLMICCMKGLSQCAETLLEYEADPNARDQISGRTALFHAAEAHNIDMVQLLLAYNADTKTKNFFGTSPHDAMYEVEEIPEEIKTLILSKSSKRKISDEPKISKIRKKGPKVELRTYPKYQKIKQFSLPRNFALAN